MIGPLVHNLLERSTQSRPEAVLAVEAGGSASYGDIENSANRTALGLLDQGIEPGDRIALITENSRFYIESYYGILKAGGIVVAMNSSGDPDTHLEMLTDCGARGMILGSRQVRSMPGLAGLESLEFIMAPLPPALKASPPDLPCRIVDSTTLLESMNSRSPDIRLSDMDRASIVYTSGSTGKPRGAVLRHRNIVANTASIVEYLELSADDRVLVVLPFHYVYGKSLLNTHVAAGGTVVLENRFMYPQKALDTLEANQVTGFAGVPSTFAILLNKSNIASRELRSLRYVTQAGGAMSPALTRRLMKAIPGKDIYIMYGATEASARLSYLDPRHLSQRMDSIGKAIPGVELRVLREDGSEADIDEVGEIVAQGPNIMEGYWNDREETASVLDDAGYHTGDLARRDKDGFFYVVGRKKEMIKSGAHRISPRRIEDTLNEHPEVNESAVVGIPDEILGEAIAACVTLRNKDSVQPDDIAGWCKARLPQYMVPTIVRILPAMPRQGSGKIDKLALVDETIS